MANTLVQQMSSFACKLMKSWKECANTILSEKIFLLELSNEEKM